MNEPHTKYIRIQINDKNYDKVLELIKCVNIFDEYVRTSLLSEIDRVEKSTNINLQRQMLEYDKFTFTIDMEIPMVPMYDKFINWIIMKYPEWIV
jgi:hypothetical protein